MFDIHINTQYGVFVKHGRKVMHDYKINRLTRLFEIRASLWFNRPRSPSEAVIEKMFWGKPEDAP